MEHIKESMFTEEKEIIENKSLSQENYEMLSKVGKNLYIYGIKEHGWYYSKITKLFATKEEAYEYWNDTYNNYRPLPYFGYIKREETTQHTNDGMWYGELIKINVVNLLYTELCNMTKEKEAWFKDYLKMENKVKIGIHSENILYLNKLQDTLNRFFKDNIESNETWIKINKD